MELNNKSFTCKEKVACPLLLFYCLQATIQGTKYWKDGDLN